MKTPHYKIFYSTDTRVSKEVNTSFEEHLHLMFYHINTMRGDPPNVGITLIQILLSQIKGKWSSHWTILVDRKNNFNKFKTYEMMKFRNLKNSDLIKIYYTGKQKITLFLTSPTQSWLDHFFRTPIRPLNYASLEPLDT